jgi:hypothetical protein
MIAVKKRREAYARMSLALVVAVMPGISALPSLAATTELVISDRLTGVALYGFDAVAYFIDGEAREGLRSFELKHAGLVWRFRNAGNRAAFAARPDDYMPRFGGYDPLAVARGVPAAGYPSLFTIHDRRLFLFLSEENRKTFLASPNEALDAAKAAWPKLTQKLAP